MGAEPNLNPLPGSPQNLLQKPGGLFKYVGALGQHPTVHIRLGKPMIRTLGQLLPGDPIRLLSV
jgi:hypothetical protein